jgi:hypothetical protein
MKRTTFTAVFLIPLLTAAVVYDTFTTGLRIFPLPILSFMQGIFLVAAPVGLCWIIARKIELSQESGSIRIEINYGRSNNMLVKEKIY